MSLYPTLADAAWLRLGIVGLDVLAVVVVVRLSAALAVWWRAPHAPRSAPATTIRVSRRRTTRP
jgi:hypothetical protein